MNLNESQQIYLNMTKILPSKDANDIFRSMIEEARKEFEETRTESRESVILRKFPIDLTIDTLFDMSHYETHELRLIRTERYKNIYIALQKDEKEKNRGPFEIPVESSEELMIKMKKQHPEHSLKYLADNFTPYKLEKNERRITEQDIIDAKICENSLFKFNPSLFYRDLLYLNVYNNSRTDKCEIYKHSRKELYLKHIYGLAGESKWIDITNYYDWKQIYLNQRTPFIQFKKY